MKKTQFIKDIKNIKVPSDLQNEMYYKVTTFNQNNHLILNFVRKPLALLTLILCLTTTIVSALTAINFLSNHTYSNPEKAPFESKLISPLEITIPLSLIDKNQYYTIQDMQSLLEIPILSNKYYDQFKFKPSYNHNTSNEITTLSFISSRPLSLDNVIESSVAISFATRSAEQEDLPKIKYNDNNYDLYHIKSINTDAIIFDISGSSNHVISKIIVFDYNNITYTTHLTLMKDHTNELNKYLDSFEV